MDTYLDRSAGAANEPARLEVTQDQWDRIADRALEIALNLGLNLVEICGDYARFGSNTGSLKVWFRGKHKGTWWDYPDSGDMIAVVRRESGRGFVDAVEFALKERIQDPAFTESKRKAKTKVDFN